MIIPTDWASAYVKCPNLWCGDGSYMTDAELNELAEVILKGHVNFDVPDILSAFNWDTTYQGEVYWRNVWDGLVNGSRTIRSDHIPQTVAAQAGWQTPGVSVGGGKVLISGGGGGGGIGVSAGSGKVVNGSAGGSPPAPEQPFEESNPVRAPDIMDITRGMFK